jgi:transcriptional regulator with XRE-family HTH domain
MERRRIPLKGLKKAREAAGLNVWQLSQLSGVAPTNLNRLENQGQRAQPATIDKLANALGVDRGELIGDVFMESPSHERQRYLDMVKELEESILMLPNDVFGMLQIRIAKEADRRRMPGYVYIDASRCPPPPTIDAGKQGIEQGNEN